MLKTPKGPHWRSETSRPRSWRGSRLLLLTLAFVLIAEAASGSGLKPPSMKLESDRQAQADSLQAGLSVRELALNVVDLTWLVEDLKADMEKTLDFHRTETDTLRWRITQLETASDRNKQHWLIATWEALDFYIGSALATILTLLSVRIGVN